jgi:hypothetical protein
MKLKKLIVSEDFIKLNSNYNLKPGGKGGWFSAKKFGADNVMRRPEVAAKVSASLKLAITQEERLTRSIRMMKMRADGTIVKPSGWNHTEETKILISKALTGMRGWNKGLKMPPESKEAKENKSKAAKLRALNQDMGALTRGKIRSPRLSCIICRKPMYVKQFDRFHVGGKCWK